MFKGILRLRKVPKNASGNLTIYRRARTLTHGSLRPSFLPCNASDMKVVSIQRMRLKKLL